MGKGAAETIHQNKIEEHSHACGKRFMKWLRMEHLQGTLPRMWEKDCVFTLFARGSVPICIKIFYTFVPTINMADFRICRQKEHEIPLV